MVVAEFIPEEDTRQSSAPSSSLSFSSTTRVVGLPYLRHQCAASVPSQLLVNKHQGTGEDSRIGQAGARNLLCAVADTKLSIQSAQVLDTAHVLAICLVRMVGSN